MLPPTPHSNRKDIAITTIWFSIAQLRNSCVPVILIFTPEDTKQVALTNACVKICIKQIPYILQDTARNIITRCTDVLRAIIFLPSNQAGRNSDMITSADRPKTKLPPKIIESITPATTIVEECSNDDTGVGLSIAMGSQYPITQSADFLRIASIPNIQLSII